MSRADIETRILDQMPAKVRQTYQANSPTTQFLVQALINEVERSERAQSEVLTRLLALEHAVRP